MGETKTKIQVIATDTSNKKINRAYSCANPESSNYNLKVFATGINGFTSNTLNQVLRIDTTNITDATSETATSNITSSISSTSDFFSTDATTFHTFLQTAYDDAIEENDNESDETVFQIMLNDGANTTLIEITYGDIATILADSNSNVQSFVSQLNTKIQNAEDVVDITASFDSTTQSLIFTSEGIQAAVDVIGLDGTLGNTILESLYNGASDKSAFTVDDESGETEYSISLE